MAIFLLSQHIFCTKTIIQLSYLKYFKNELSYCLPYIEQRSFKGVWTGLGSLEARCFGKSFNIDSHGPPIFENIGNMALELLPLKNVHHHLLTKYNRNVHCIHV